MMLSLANARWGEGVPDSEAVPPAPPLTSLSPEMSPCSLRNCNCMARCNCDRCANVRWEVVDGAPLGADEVVEAAAASRFFSSPPDSDSDPEAEDDLERIAGQRRVHTVKP